MTLIPCLASSQAWPALVRGLFFSTLVFGQLFALSCAGQQHAQTVPKASEPSPSDGRQPGARSGLDDEGAELPTVSAAQRKEAGSRLQRARELQREGDLDGAIVQVREALAITPLLASAHLALGVLLRDQGHLEQSLKAFEQAHRLDSSAALPLALMGAVLLRLGRDPEAIEPLQHAIEANPKDVASHLNLGTALRRLDRPEDAIRVYRAGLRLDPANADLNNNLGVALRKLDRDTEAIAFLERAVNDKPDIAVYRFNLAVALMGVEQYGPALEELHRATALDPADPRPLYYKGLCFAALGKNAQAVEAFEAYATAVQSRDPASAAKARQKAENYR